MRDPRIRVEVLLEGALELDDRQRSLKRSGVEMRRPVAEPIHDGTATCSVRHQAPFGVHHLALISEEYLVLPLVVDEVLDTTEPRRSVARTRTKLPTGKRATGF